MLQTETRERTEFGEDPEAAVADATPTGRPSLPAVCRELFFQRCPWRGTPAYRRSCCRACGSRAFSREGNASAGVLVRRNGDAQHHTWFAAIDESFNLLCQVTGTAPVVVGVDAR
ncbi:UNVERIFIED_CONTAM: hypothetical protein RKD50_000310 [Streptomyces canus]